MEVRPVTLSDINALTDLVEARRAALETYAPQFWKRAKDAAKNTRIWFGMLVEDPNTVFLAAEDRGTIIGCAQARPVNVPPVYDPGPTATVDDLCVKEGADVAATTASLLAGLKKELAARGFSQIVIVCADREHAMKHAIQSAGFAPTSAWFAGPAAS